MKHLYWFCALLLLMAGCKPKSAAPDIGAPAIKSYAVRGIVEQIAPDRRKVAIHHETIPGYMPEMTMAFTVKDTNELKNISPADEVAFLLFVGENDHWIENIRCLGHHVGNVTNGMFAFDTPRVASGSGETFPDGELLTETGSRMRLSDFRGRAVAITFFYTRCPLPDYCPRMNKNLAAARDLILAAPQAPTNWQFLSISFDPQFDQPGILSSYADAYRQSDSRHWLFAAASASTLADWTPRVNLIIFHEGAGISHNLRTRCWTHKVASIANSKATNGRRNSLPTRCWGPRTGAAGSLLHDTGWGRPPVLAQARGWLRAGFLEDGAEKIRPETSRFSLCLFGLPFSA